MGECKVKENMARCSCSYAHCPRKGICCECLSYHFSQGQFPACLFPSDIEKTYDRSIERFIQTYQKRGSWWGEKGESEK